jgi:hypothetical protein
MGSRDRSYKSAGKVRSLHLMLSGGLLELESRGRMRCLGVVFVWFGLVKGGT